MTSTATEGIATMTVSLKKVRRVRVTVDEVAADPTNAFQVRVHGDAAIRSLTIHGEGPNRWTKIEWVGGGSEAGCPAHWGSYVRYI